jgi:ribosome-binding factor A
MSHRFNQVADHYHEAIANVLAEVVEFPRGTLVTVLDAKPTRDSRFVKVVLSVLPVTEEETVRKALARATHDIKDALAETLRMRRIPELVWAFDETEEEASHIEAAIQELKQKGEL